MKHLGSAQSPEQVMTLAKRMAELDLHLQLHFESSLVHELMPAFAHSPVPIVIDHMGRVDASLGAQHVDFQGLLRWLDKPNIHVKVSGIDRIQAQVDGQGMHASGYPMGVALAKELVAKFPEQCVWGLDWPHPNHTHIPDDGELIDALAQIAPSQVAQQRLLVDNPRSLYRFTD